MFSITNDPSSRRPDNKLNQVSHFLLSTGVRPHLDADLYYTKSTQWSITQVAGHADISLSKQWCSTGGKLGKSEPWSYLLWTYYLWKETVLNRPVNRVVHFSHRVAFLSGDKQCGFHEPTHLPFHAVRLDLSSLAMTCLWTKVIANISHL